MYSLDVHQKPKESKMRAKGIKKAYVRKNVRHTHFLNVLRTQQSTTSEFCKFQSTNHVIQTVKVTKKCLDAFDDKRYILEDGVTTLVYGHKDIRCANK